MPSLIPNVLAERYATEPMRSIWSPEGKILLERELWIAVLKAQRDLGLGVPDGVVEAYESVKEQIDVESIMQRERVTRHDVKARIEEFCDLAGHEHIHKGMTSRDLTENVEQLQVFRSLLETRKKAAAALLATAKAAEEWKDLPLSARTHNVAAQVTTLGKRIAMFGEELSGAFQHLQQIVDTYPVRGMKGAVGTQLDQLQLFGGDASQVAKLEHSVVQHLGLPDVSVAVGQVYPRSLDFRVVSALVELASGPGDFARTLRLMAGHELMSEGFAKGQVGSSAMPHKMNSRSCERINGFHVLLKGYAAMASGLAGDQWNEGDVSCSVVRRVMLPDSFFAIDGLLETYLTVLNQMEVFPGVVNKEVSHYLPFLLTTTVLMESVKAGAGREAAHEAIKEHAVATIRDLRGDLISENDLAARLAGDARVGLTEEALAEIMERGRGQIGAAGAQVEHFCKTAKELASGVEGAMAYQPGSIL